MKQNYCHWRGSVLAPLAKPLYNHPLAALLLLVDNAKDANSLRTQVTWKKLVTSELVVTVRDYGYGMTERMMILALTFLFRRITKHATHGNRAQQIDTNQYWPA